MYQNSPIVGDAANVSLPINNVNEPPTLSTFLSLVAHYLLPTQWPKVAPFDENETDYPLINQLPGANEFRALSLLLHPDRRPVRQASSHQRRPVRSGSRVYQQQCEDDEALWIPSRDRDVLDQVNAAHGTLLNAAYDLWKPIILNPPAHIKKASYVCGKDDAREFATSRLSTCNSWNYSMNGLAFPCIP